MWACQATPKQEIVKTKEQSFLQQHDSKEDIKAGISSIKNVWEDEFLTNDGKISVEVKAIVQAEKDADYAVYNALPHIFSSDDAAFMSSILTDGKTDELYADALTKDEIENKILEYKKYIHSIEETGRYPDGQEVSEAARAQITKEYSQRIQKLEEYHKTAQDSKTKDNFAFEGGQLSVRTDGTEAYDIFAHFDADGSSSYYLSAVFAQDITPDKEGYDLNSEKAAEKTATEYLNRITNEFKKVSSIPVSYTNTAENNKRTAYKITFARVIDGIPVNLIQDNADSRPIIADGEMLDKTYDIYVPPRTAEVMEMIVDGDKILEFSWINPTQSGEVINGEIALLNFDEIISTAKKQIQLSYMAEGDINKDIVLTQAGEREIVISEITLGYAVIRKHDDAESFIYIPVWDITGKFKNSDTIYGNSKICFLTLNAFDGSVINRNLGY